MHETGRFRARVFLPRTQRRQVRFQALFLLMLYLLFVLMYWHLLRMFVLMY